MNQLQPIIPMADLERMAKAICTSNLFGIKDVNQAVALMLISQAEGKHPAIIARDYNIIDGRPSKKSEAMLRDLIACGGKVDEWHQLTETVADATFSHPQGGKVRIKWTIEMAIDAGLANKQNWQKYPRAMLRSRTISEGCRTVCPAATSGLYTPEEVADFADEPPKNVTPAKPIDAAQYAQLMAPAEATTDVIANLQAAIDRYAKQTAVTPTQATLEAFQDETGSMTFEKIARLKSPKQIEKAKAALTYVTNLLSKE